MLPIPDEPASDSLAKRIRREIHRRGPLDFARFMELALYDPAGGYYARSEESLGPGGDYVTASDSGPWLGRCLARQVADLDRQIGTPDPFHVIEWGAGRGWLARDVIAALTEDHGGFAGRMRYLAVDRSVAMRERIAASVRGATVLEPDATPRGLTGCVIAVELFDALPVHRVRRGADGGLRELFVDVDGAGRLMEREGPPADRVRRWAERYGAARWPGSEAEVALAAADVLERIVAGLEKGVVIVIDYGEPAAPLYGADRRRGTLLAYHRHATNEEYLARVGEQDLTAHVNFTALEDRARELGLTVLGRTTQDRFLIGNGLIEMLERLEPATERPSPASLQARLDATRLIHPHAMGRRFKVLLLAKGCAADLDPAGLHDPFRHDTGGAPGGA